MQFGDDQLTQNADLFLFETTVSSLKATYRAKSRVEDQFLPTE